MEKIPLTFFKILVLATCLASPSVMGSDFEKKSPAAELVEFLSESPSLMDTASFLQSISSYAKTDSSLSEILKIVSKNFNEKQIWFLHHAIVAAFPEEDDRFWAATVIVSQSGVVSGATSAVSERLRYNIVEESVRKAPGKKDEIILSALKFADISGDWLLSMKIKNMLGEWDF